MRFNHLPSVIKISLFLVILQILNSPVSAQQSVSIGTTVVKSNAVLFLYGNGQQGLIMPIVNGITGTFGEIGMVVYNKPDNKLYYHTGTGWVVAGGASTGTPAVDGSTINLDATSRLQIKDAGVITTKIQDKAITSAKLDDNIAITGNLSVTGRTNFNGSVYTWPNTPAGVNTFLKNDGTGVLSWAAASGSLDQTTKTGVLFGNGSAISGLSSTGSLQYLRRNATNTAYEFGSLPALTATDIPDLDAAKITTGRFPLARIAGEPTNSKAILGSSGGNANWVTGLPNQILGTDGTGNISFFNTANNMILKGGSPGLRPSQIIDDGINVGIGVPAPEAKLHVKSSAVGSPALKIEDGTQGLGKILVSDANGTASWGDRDKSTYNKSNGLNTQSLALANDVFQKIDDYLTFTKNSDASTIEVNLNTRAVSGLFSSSPSPGAILFEVRIDGVSSLIDNKAAIMGSAANEFISIFSVFTGLPKGPHTVSVWAKTIIAASTSSNIILDPGGLGGKIIVKETY